jgi:Na+:H+ antiporter, NhaA family
VSREPDDRTVATALRDFVGSNVSGGVLLLLAAVVALVWSNSFAYESYETLWHTEFGLGLGAASLSMSLGHWVNDGLMVVFFLLVGLEIKRELLVGELDTVQRALLPATAALAGAVLPALIFLAIVGPGSDAARGWGVPMATDIAFALGVLALAGRRVPGTLRIFVTALAIVDDLLAILIIAIFYSSNISVVALAAAAVLVALLIAANRAGVRSLVVYGALGFALWLAVLESGVHATVAGVLLALTIPGPKRLGEHRDDQQRNAPLVRLEHLLEKPVAFAIVPLFALANAGVHIEGVFLDLLAQPIVIGIVCGLIVGKQVGITVSSLAVLRTKVAHLPPGVAMRHVYAASWVCGIGFTMSLFIAQLAYQDAEHLAQAKVGILCASVIAGLVGFVVLNVSARRT